MEYLNRKQYSAKFRAFSTAAKTINDTAHILLCSAFMLADPNQDDSDENLDRIRKLMLAFPRGTRVEAVAKWIRDHFPVNVKISGENIEVKSQKKGFRNPEYWNHEAAAATPFWEYSKEIPPRELDPWKAVSSLADRIEGIVKGKRKGRIKGDPETALRVAEGLKELEGRLTA